jgi:hypothetical protein
VRRKPVKVMTKVKMRTVAKTRIKKPQLKAEASKKRLVEAPKKTHVPDQKAKFITPEKTGEFFFFFTSNL